uniref:Uncharacterized protein n=1 Tax=Trichogramma kaykai TaxID=54128 RepID=A0ABD2WCN2_9HYME
MHTSHTRNSRKRKKKDLHVSIGNKFNSLFDITFYRGEIVCELLARVTAWGSLCVYVICARDSRAFIPWIVPARS